MVAGPAQFPTSRRSPYIPRVILLYEGHGKEFRVPASGARLGRDPSLEITFPEEENVVSALHARVFQKDDESWWLEDLGSTNGTWLGGSRVSEPVPLASGDRFSLGQHGPTLAVAVREEVAGTRAEPAAAPAEPRLRLRRVRGGQDLEARGEQIVIGRGAGCGIPLRTVADTVVSKRHAVVEFDSSGAASITDLGSRNGTYINAYPIRGRTPLGTGDRIMLGWEGPLFEVRILGGAAMPEDQGAPYQPKREPPKTLAGMVQVAGERARRPGGVRPGLFVGVMARQMVTESSLAFRVVTLGMMAALLAAIAFVYQTASQRAAAAEARLESAEREFSAQIRTATEAQQRSSQEIARLQRDLDAARRSAVSRAVLDSLERRLREAESRGVLPSSSPSASPGPAADFTRVARDNQRAVGLVIVSYAADSVMGSGFAITPSGYFVTNRHVVQDESRGPPRGIQVVMAETNVALAADVMTVSSIAEQDIAVLKIRGYRGPSVRDVDWRGRGAQQGAPAAMLGFPFGTQLALDRLGYIHANMFGGIIAQTGEWIRFSSPTYAGVSGSPVFNADGEVIAVHFGAPRAGPGLGVSVPMSKVRQWLPAEARAELGL